LVSLALLENFIRFFVLEKVVRQAEDCVTNCHNQRTRKWWQVLRAAGFWSQLQKSSLNKRKSHPPKHMKPTINCITLAVDDLKKSEESPTAQQAKDPLPRWLAETGFAAGYLLKGFDLMPDHLPEMGLADDALILQRVIERNLIGAASQLAECIELAVSNSR
jgi:uncharacterized protein DUF1232